LESMKKVRSIDTRRFDASNKGTGTGVKLDVGQSLLCLEGVFMKYYFFMYMLPQVCYRKPKRGSTRVQVFRKYIMKFVNKTLKCTHRFANANLNVGTTVSRF
jgi:hypothetical protein